MTLIQTLLTPTGVLQVSDRQLTYPSGRIHTDPANKAVIWCGHIVIGFTGMAFTDSSQQRTISEWIAFTLRGAVTLGDACEALQQAGTELMIHTDYGRRALTMVFAGSPPGSGEVLMFAISNNRQSRASPGIAEDRFYRSNTLNVPVSGQGYLYKTAGVRISDETERHIENQLRRIHARFGVDHATRRVVAIQRRVREKQIQQSRGSTVGRSAMIVSLPAVTDPQPAVTFITTNPLNGAVREGLPMYSFVRSNGFSPTRFGPHFVCGGGVGLDLESGAHRDDHTGKPKQWSRIRVG
jgi:hypothetical protein